MLLILLTLIILLMITTTVMVSDVRILTADHPSLTVPPRVWPQS